MVVCNNVLLVVPRERIADSLREIERIAKPEARIFLGEIPFVPGPPPEPEFASVRETLIYFYRRHRVRATLGMLRRIAYWKLTGKPAIIRGGASVSFRKDDQERSRHRYSSRVYRIAIPVRGSAACWLRLHISGFD